MPLASSLTAISRRLWSSSSSSKRSASAQPSRTLRITCRGKPIHREDLFKYTNGRFLANENQACGRRYVTFDIERLCAIAASTGGQQYSPVDAIEKMEGGFSKALLLHREDGSEIIAKIPFPIAGPPKYTTASEVAVLKYLHEHTQVPVPKILAWSCDATNPVGAEYIMMEKARGTQLFEKWDKISEMDQLGIVQQLTKLEGEMAAICLPASGSLYLRESMSKDDGDAYIALDHDADPYQQFCIGPSCERGWYSQDNEATCLHSHFNRGPWLNLSAFGIALVERERARLERTPTIIKSDPPRGSFDEHIAVLKMTKDIMSMLDDESWLISKVSEPVLWHTDLHMGNIYVSHESSATNILSLIDWQSITVAPLFLQARFPEFLPIGEDYTLGITALPQRPQNFQDMDAEDQEYAEFEFKQAKLAKAYELTSGYENNQAYKALQIPSFVRDLFVRCGEISEEGVVPLRACLIELSKVWHDLGFTGPCPVKFSEAEMQTHEQQFEAYRNFHGVQELARKILGTDVEGWIAPQLDFMAKKQQSQELFEELMRSSNGFNMSPDGVRRIWPYHERAEVTNSKH